jgi:hypothetical protein
MAARSSVVSTIFRFLLLLCPILATIVHFFKLPYMNKVEQVILETMK